MRPSLERLKQLPSSTTSMSEVVTASIRRRDILDVGSVAKFMKTDQVNVLPRSLILLSICLLAIRNLTIRHLTIRLHLLLFHLLLIHIRLRLGLIIVLIIRPVV